MKLWACGAVFHLVYSQGAQCIHFNRVAYLMITLQHCQFCTLREYRFPTVAVTHTTECIHSFQQTWTWTRVPIRYIRRPPSVVCNIRAPYSADWNFPQCFQSMPFGTLAIPDLSVKILVRLSQGNPSIGKVTHKRNLAILDPSNTISWKRCKTGAKFILITNRKSHMSFWLVPNSVTLDDIEWSNIPNCSIISPNLVGPSFWGGLCKNGWRYTNTFCSRNVGQKSSF